MEGLTGREGISRLDRWSERRRKLRIPGPFAVRVRGKDSSGVNFDTHSALDNLSSGGLYLRLEHCVREAAKLFFLIQFSNAGSPGIPGLRVAACGLVRRIEPQTDGRSGVGVEFLRYRML